MRKKLIYIILFSGALSLSTFGRLHAAETFQLNLKSGLNYISIPIGVSSNIKDVLAGVSATKKQAAYWDAANKAYLLYANDPDFNQFSTFEYAKGYWLYLENPNPTTITLTGYIPSNYTLNLKAGWNAIGCPINQPAAVEQALLPLQLGTDYAAVYRYSSATAPWYQQYSANTKEFTNLTPGEGYWIYMVRDTVWNINPIVIPEINSAMPGDGSLIKKGAAITLSIEAEGNGNLEYQFSINGTVKQAWSYNKTYNWPTSSESRGNYKFKFEARNQKGKAAKENEIYLIEKPPFPGD